MDEVTNPRDESRDVWVLSMLLDDVLANGGPLEIFARATLSPKEHPESWTRLTPHSDLLSVEQQLEQATRERDGWMNESARNAQAADEWRYRAETAERLLGELLEASSHAYQSFSGESATEFIRIRECFDAAAIAARQHFIWLARKSL